MVIDRRIRSFRHPCFTCCTTIMGGTVRGINVLAGERITIPTKSC
jgi:hypothetical protein